MKKYNVNIPVWELISVEVEAENEEEAEEKAIEQAIEEQPKVCWQVDTNIGLEVSEVQE